MSHLSSLTLERMSVDDLSGAARTEAESHLQACPQCSDALRRLQTDHAAHLVARPPEHFMMQVAARRVRAQRRRWVGVTTFASTIAVAAAVLVGMRPTGDSLRMKGHGLTVYRLRAEVVSRLDEGDRVRAGDAIELAPVRAKAERLAAWSVDKSGKVDRITDGVVTVPAGDAPLATSAVIDSPCVDAWVLVTDREGKLAATDEQLREVVNGYRSGQKPDGFEVRALRCE
jgi:hypothetical protein